MDARLEGMDPAERQRLYKRALKMRQAASEKASAGRRGRREWKRTRSRSGWDDEEESTRDGERRRRRGEGIDYWMRKVLDDVKVEDERRGESAGEASVQGTVIAVYAGGCTVLCRDERYRLRFPDDLAAVQRSAVAVGDQVSFDRGNGAIGALRAVFPRKSVLSRPDPAIPQRERVIASNIDAAVIVVSVIAPPLRVRLIDRFLVAIQRGGAQPILCVNKIDLAGSSVELARELARLAPYEGMGFPIIPASAADGRGIAELGRAVVGRRCVFVGHSGVGKSSLANALVPGLGLPARTVSETSGKGRHTTTSSALIRLPDGTELIDTPGIRQFGLWKLTRGELRWSFPEFEGEAQACRFTDCTHAHEPECAVRRAASEGRIPPARYETYRRLMRTLEP